MDFIVDVEGGRDPIILQISDIQIIDAAQKRTPDRIGDYACAYWATDKMEDRCFKYVRETVDAVKPDLILMAGDIANKGYYITPHWNKNDSMKSRIH